MFWKYLKDQSGQFWSGFAGGVNAAYQDFQDRQLKREELSLRKKMLDMQLKSHDIQDKLNQFNLEKAMRQDKATQEMGDLWTKGVTEPETQVPAVQPETGGIEQPEFGTPGTLPEAPSLEQSTFKVPARQRPATKEELLGKAVQADPQHAMAQIVKGLLGSSGMSESRAFPTIEAALAFQNSPEFDQAFPDGAKLEQTSKGFQFKSKFAANPAWGAYNRELQTTKDPQAALQAMSNVIYGQGGAGAAGRTEGAAAQFNNVPMNPMVPLPGRQPTGAPGGQFLTPEQQQQIANLPPGGSMQIPTGPQAVVNPQTGRLTQPGYGGLPGEQQVATPPPPTPPTSNYPTSGNKGTGAAAGTMSNAQRAEGLKKDIAREHGALPAETQQFIAGSQDVLAKLESVKSYSNAELETFVGMLKQPKGKLAQAAAAIGNELPTRWGFGETPAQKIQNDRFGTFQTTMAALRQTAFGIGGKQLTPFEAEVVFGFTPNGSELGGAAQMRSKLQQMEAFTKAARDVRVKLAREGRGTIDLNELDGIMRNQLQPFLDNLRKGQVLQAPTPDVMQRYWTDAQGNKAMAEQAMRSDGWNPNDISRMGGGR